MTRKEWIQEARERVVGAAKFFLGGPRVTQERIAKRAGSVAGRKIRNGLITEYAVRYPDVEAAIMAVRKMSAKEKVLIAIEHFRINGLRANLGQVTRKARVSRTSARRCVISSAQVRQGLAQIKPVCAVSNREIILMAIKQAVKRGRRLSCAEVRALGFGLTTYYKHIRRDPDVRELSRRMPPVSQTRLKLLAVLAHLGDSRQRANRRQICTSTQISPQVLSYYENQPDGIVRSAVARVLPETKDL